MYLTIYVKKIGGHRQSWGGHFWRVPSLRGPEGGSPPLFFRQKLQNWQKLLVTKTFILYFFTKLFKVVNKMTIPDGPLANLLGSDESFKSIQLFKLLRLAKHIQPS